MDITDYLLEEYRIIKKYIDAGDLPGASFSFVTRDEIAFSHYGNKSLIPEKTEIADDTLYDLASLSKVVSTSTMVAKLIEEGLIDFDTKVSSIINRFRYDDVTIRNLIVHTSGLPADDKNYKKCKTPEELWEFTLNVDKTYETNSKVEYSCFNYIILGKIIEHFKGNMEEYANEVLFNKLGTGNIMYNPGKKGRKEDCAPTEVTDIRGVIQGDVHDGKAYILGGVAGNAGVFADIESVSRFAQMMLNNGMNEDNIILNKETTNLFKQSYTEGLNESRTMGGWYFGDPNTSAGNKISKCSLYHTGFSGTSVYIDYERKCAIALLTNAIHPSRETKIKEIRPAFYNDILEYIDNH